MCVRDFGIASLTQRGRNSDDGCMLIGKLRNTLMFQQCCSVLFIRPLYWKLSAFSSGDIIIRQLFRFVASISRPSCTFPSPPSASSESIVVRGANKMNTKHMRNLQAIDWIGCGAHLSLPPHRGLYNLFS